jgi:hypothetical protein
MSFDEDEGDHFQVDPASMVETQLIVKYGLEHESPRLASLSEHQLQGLKEADVAY